MKLLTFRAFGLVGEDALHSLTRKRSAVRARQRPPETFVVVGFSELPALRPLASVRVWSAQRLLARIASRLMLSIPRQGTGHETHRGEPWLR